MEYDHEKKLWEDDKKDGFGKMKWENPEQIKHMKEMLKAMRDKMVRLPQT